MKAFRAARATAVGDPMQEILDTARRIGSEQSFLVGVRILTGSISATEAGAAYATLAERLIAALFEEVTREMEEDHGRVPGGGAVVVAMGKLGGRELTAASDVDLILIYDFDADAEQSDGAKPLAPPHYYTRLTQRLINAISARTAEGALYEVDMRLRPSGQKGPVATRLSSFTNYQTTEAWTWEHMALTRARVIAGSRELGARVEGEIHKVLTARRDPSKITADIRDMRQRIETEKNTTDIWDLKQVRAASSISSSSPSTCNSFTPRSTRQFLTRRHSSRSPQRPPRASSARRITCASQKGPAPARPYAGAAPNARWTV